MKMSAIMSLCLSLVCDHSIQRRLLVVVLVCHSSFWSRSQQTQGIFSSQWQSTYKLAFGPRDVGTLISLTSNIQKSLKHKQPWSCISACDTLWFSGLLIFRLQDYEGIYFIPHLCGTQMSNPKITSEFIFFFVLLWNCQDGIRYVLWQCIHKLIINWSSCRLSSYIHSL